MLHGDGQGHGPASSWAARARPGDPLTLLGPDRRSGLPPAGIEWRPLSTGSPRVLLLGDEPAAPAVCSILESLPPDAVGHALLEVPERDDRQECDRPAGVELGRLPRERAPPGQQLLRAVDRVLQPAGPAVAAPLDDDPDELLWETPREPPAGVYAWVAGEAAMVRALRRHLVGPCGLDRSAVAFMGYWREGRAEG